MVSGESVIPEDAGIEQPHAATSANPHGLMPPPNGSQSGMERVPNANHGSSGRFRYGPVAVETRQFRRPVPPVAFDCVKLLLIREGSTVLTTDEGTTRASEGDLVFLRTAVLCSGTPEGPVTVSTVYLDTDYLFELWFWQLAPVGHDKEALRAHAIGGLPHG